MKKKNVIALTKKEGEKHQRLDFYQNAEINNQTFFALKSHYKN